MAQGIFTLKQVNQAIRQNAWPNSPPKFVEYLVVAGGGGGSTSVTSGGGGAGGLLTGVVSVTPGASYNVTVGAGGTTATTTGNSGVNSVFASITALGGGGGSQAIAGATSGGSGGGGGGGINDFSGQGTAGQGNAGGGGITAAAPPYPSRGGGGAGTAGLNAFVNIAGNGGAGIASSISGTVTTYAGGGGGGVYGSGIPGAGGAGGGGGGGAGSNNTSATGTAGSTNTGGGGGGAGLDVGAAGGSGIVIVRYPGNVVFYTGGTVNYNNGHISHIFNATGTLAPTAPTVYNTSYQISRSLRFNNPTDAAYLNRTPATTTNRRTFTFSVWVKRGSVDTNYRTLFSNTLAGENILFWDASGGLSVWNLAGNYQLTTTQMFRDPSAWYHIVVAFDTTQATSSNRIKIYVNGVQVTALVTSTYPSQNFDTAYNTTTAQYIGWNEYNYYNGYMTEVNFIDGQQLTPSSFGATSTTTGVWAPIKYTGTYGTNGFYLNFSDNTNTTAATLGKDYSGNGNNWTPNNFSVTAGVGNDSMVDVPTLYGFDTGVGGSVRGNYCTFNPLDRNSSLVITNGNLDVTENTANWINGRCTFGMSSGKWYAESTLTAGLYQVFGIANSSTINTGYSEGSVVGNWAYSTDGARILNGAYTAGYGATSTTNDVIGMAFDADVGTLTMYKNGVSQGVLVSGLPANTYFPWVALNSYASSGGSATVSLNFGQRPFTYTAPSGFKALCTQNLPTPAIGGSSETLASKFFNTVLWTGDGSQTRSITGVGFQPDFTWMKIRADTPQSGQLYDVVRGAGGGKGLAVATTAVEGTVNGFPDADYGYVSSFDSGGFSVNDGAVATTGGYVNFSGRTYVAWNWRAGNNAGVSNREGTIASTVSANPRSGFSIVTWTGTGGSGTVGHGLGVAPSMYIVKPRNDASGYDWNSYHVALGNTQFMALNTTAAVSSAANLWNNTTPTSVVFSLTAAAAVNTAGILYVAYCFAEVAGYSKFGSYTGNGSADGPFVHLGFRPAFVMVKRTSSSGTNWQILDTKRSTYNVMADYLYASASNVEGYDTGVGIDSLSNGFKIRGTDGNTNTSTATYIYMAFAENPFKYSLAR